MARIDSGAIRLISDRSIAPQIPHIRHCSQHQFGQIARL
jgi:hypothetical protein